MARLGLLQVTLRVLEPHLEAVGLGLDLPQLGLLPLRLHLLLGEGGRKKGVRGEVPGEAMTHLGPPPDPQDPRRGAVLGLGAARPRNVPFWGSASNA